jgi:hypothetical protein
MIESYRFGSITVDGKTYHSDLIIYPDHVRDSWWRREGHLLQLSDLGEVLDYGPEALVVGQGKPGRLQVSEQTAAEIRRRGIELFVAPTATAVEKYNELSRAKKVVAALHLTC